MADNFQVTEGSGLTVATDDVSSVHYQKVKIQRGEDGKTTSDVLYAKIDCSSSGANQIVAAVTSKHIRVLSFLISASAAVNGKWQSASTDITGLIYMDAKGGATGDAQDGLFETASGEALNLNLSGSVAVGGYVAYVTEAA
jgi:hypothetical protein